MKKFEVEYKGHRIRVENRVSGERLIVDDELQDEQIGSATRSRLYGRIKGGKGDGETIKVSIGGWFTANCRIFVDDKRVFPE